MRWLSAPPRLLRSRPYSSRLTRSESAAKMQRTTTLRKNFYMPGHLATINLTDEVAASVAGANKRLLDCFCRPLCRAFVDSRGLHCPFAIHRGTRTNPLWPSTSDRFGANTRPLFGLSRDDEWGA